MTGHSVHLRCHDRDCRGGCQNLQTCLTGGWFIPKIRRIDEDFFSFTLLRADWQSVKSAYFRSWYHSRVSVVPPPLPHIIIYPPPHTKQISSQQDISNQFLKLSRVSNSNSLRSSTRIRSKSFNLFDNVFSLENLAKDNVTS